MAAPRSPVEVRLAQRGLGFRGVQALEFIINAGRPVRPYEIKRGLGFSPDDDSAVIKIIIRLERKGLIERQGSGCHNVLVTLAA